MDVNDGSRAVDNIDYDGTVHASDDDGLPLCGTADVPACEPEATTDPVTCQDCKAITD